MPNLDDALNEHYPGRVVRKDLLHAVKKGTNVPSPVLEFLLAKYCASDEPEEIEADKQAVIETLEGRRRIKEQVNTRTRHEEYANIRLSCIASANTVVEVFCPESKNAEATQTPSRRQLEADHATGEHDEVSQGDED